MGLFDKAKELIKGELIDVVEWLDNSQNIILHRFDRRNDGAIKNGAQLTVRESQVAVFVNEGEKVRALLEKDGTVSPAGFSDT